MCTSVKTTSLLIERIPKEASEQLERILVIENSGNTDLLIKEAESIMKKTTDPNIQLMVQLIIRKHIYCNKNLSFSKKQKIIDKFFGKGTRKAFLTSTI